MELLLRDAVWFTGNHWEVDRVSTGFDGMMFSVVQIHRRVVASGAQWSSQMKFSINEVEFHFWSCTG